jgi:hypothetical protein
VSGVARGRRDVADANLLGNREMEAPSQTEPTALRLLWLRPPSDARPLSRVRDDSASSGSPAERTRNLIDTGNSARCGNGAGKGILEPETLP